MGSFRPFGEFDEIINKCTFKFIFQIAAGSSMTDARRGAKRKRKEKSKWNDYEPGTLQR